jgi:hypothetical protein
MTETIERLIQARFKAVANPIDDGDWSDVLARMAGRRARLAPVPRRAALVAAAAVLALVVAAVGFGWPQTFIDFFRSPPAPTNVKNWFGAENVSAPPGMSPGTIPGQARKIATATFDVNHLHALHPTTHTLYVAPRKGGGFCYLWTDASGGCLPATPPSNLKSMGPLGLDWFGSDGNYVVLASGWVRAGATKSVEARFADGTTATIPVTWVSAPVNAGFLVYPVPAAHRTRADALASVVALDANGNVIGRQEFPLTKPLDEDVLQTLPDGTKFSLPRRAQAARAHKIVSFRATDGSQVYLWVMPRTGGGVCYLYDQGQGCLDPRFEPQMPTLNGGPQGGAGSRVLFFEQTKPDVAAIELRYQNGQSERLTPIDGFVLTEITPAHYRRGTRPAAAVALDRSGEAIYTQRFQPRAKGVYPCKKPVDQGYGVKECP